VCQDAVWAPLQNFANVPDRQRARVTFTCSPRPAAGSREGASGRNALSGGVRVGVLRCCEQRSNGHAAQGTRTRSSSRARSPTRLRGSSTLVHTACRPPRPRLFPNASTRSSVEGIPRPATSHDDRATDDASSSPDPRVTRRPYLSPLRRARANASPPSLGLGSTARPDSPVTSSWWRFSRRVTCCCCSRRSRFSES
jgi:hypothetical protein